VILELLLLLLPVNVIEALPALAVAVPIVGVEGTLNT
jgi:hypothetical protein